MKKPLWYLALAIAIWGGWLYVTREADVPKLPPNDPLAVEALTLVKTHSARQAPTIEDAIAEILAKLEAQGIPYHTLGWRVAQEKPGIYIVSWLIREKGDVGWIERDYAWRVNVKEKAVRVITLPATHLMPFHELPPLPHSQEISGLSPGLFEEARPG